MCEDLLLFSLFSGLQHLLSVAFCIGELLLMVDHKVRLVL